MSELLIRGGRVFDPATGKSDVRDLRVAGPEASEIDARGCLVTPGWIDLHVHFREPGHEHKETVRTGARAAAAGGFTTVCAMANTGRPVDTPEAVHFVRSRPARVRVLPIAAVTRGIEGGEVTDFAALVDAGAVAFSDDGRPIQDAGVMRRALEQARLVDRPVVTHAEDATLTAGAIMHEGAVSAKLGLPGAPAEAEEAMVARDIALARLTGARLHVAHVSTRRAVELVRAAKREGVRVTAEVTPHHLTLTDAAMAAYDGRFKMNPPLRGADDVAACLEGLRDGTIDAIASDHAPHAAEEKDRDLASCPFGVVGLETTAAVIWRLVHEGALDERIAVRALTEGPRSAFGLPVTDGDWTVFDPAEEWTIDPAAFRSMGRHTPFAGWRVRGRVRATVVGGEVCYSSTATT